MEEKKMILGLCEGRHSIPQVSEYIFPMEVNPLDLVGLRAIVHESLSKCTELEVYVTGLTVALTVVIDYCIINLIPLTLWHFNRETGEYYSQVISTSYFKPYLVEGGYIR